MGTKAFKDAVAVLTVEYDEFEATKIASLLAHKGLLRKGLSEVEQRNLSRVWERSERLEEIYCEIATYRDWTEEDVAEVGSLEAELSAALPSLLDLIERLK